jgi:hypothetical protein
MQTYISFICFIRFKFFFVAVVVVYIHIYCAHICKWILFFSVCSHSYSPRIVDVFLLSHVVSMFGRSKLAQVVCNANLHSWLGHLPKRPGRIEKICAEKRRWWRFYELSSWLALISRRPKAVQGGWTWHFKSRGTDQSRKYAICSTHEEKNSSYMCQDMRHHETWRDLRLTTIAPTKWHPTKWPRRTRSMVSLEEVQTRSQSSKVPKPLHWMVSNDRLGGVVLRCAITCTCRREGAGGYNCLQGTVPASAVQPCQRKSHWAWLMFIGLGSWTGSVQLWFNACAAMAFWTT